MLNCKFKKHLFLIFAVIFLLSLVSGAVGYDKNVELAKRKLTVTGDGSMVTAYDYFQNVVKQVGGYVAIRSTGDKDLRKIKLPQSFVKGQVLLDVFNNFCTVYKGFDYKFSKNVVNIYPAKVIAETRIIEDYQFAKGAFYVTIGMSFNFYMPYFKTGWEEIDTETEGASLSLDYMFSSRFSLGINLHEDGYRISDEDTSWNFYNLKLWFDYHYYLFGVHFYSGVGLGVIFKNNDYQDSLYYELNNDEATLDKSVFVAFRTGFMIRLYKNFNLRVEGFVANKFYTGVTAGISMKL